jgi:hypothetical protein
MARAPDAVVGLGDDIYSDDGVVAAHAARAREDGDAWEATHCAVCFTEFLLVSFTDTRRPLPCCTGKVCNGCVRRAYEGDLFPDPLCPDRQLSTGGRCPVCRSVWTAPVHAAAQVPVEVESVEPAAQEPVQAELRALGPLDDANWSQPAEAELVEAGLDIVPAGDLVIAEAPGDEPSQSQTQDDPLTQGGGALPLLDDADWGLNFVDATRRAPSVDLVDPVTAVLHQIRAAGTRAELRLCMHPPNLTHGFRNTEETYHTVSLWCRQVVIEESSTVNEIAAASAQVSLRYLVPIPHRVAIGAVGVRNGWPKTGLLQGLLVNMTWLEHHSTRLVDAPGEEHKRAATIAALFGGPPSIRKTSLNHFVSRRALQTSSMPPAIRDGVMLCSDGTPKGHRSAIESYHRSGIDTSEACSAYATTASANDGGRGLHLANKNILLKYVNGEHDATMTGHGNLQLTDYCFRHYVLGQIPIIMEILEPGDVGYPKRFHQEFANEADLDPDQACDASEAFLIGNHEWAAVHCLPVASDHHPDGFASAMLGAALRAIRDFVAAHPNLNSAIKEKLCYADSDLQRLSNAVMRLCQYEESLAASCHDPQPSSRKAWNCWEQIYALHNWKRQLSIYTSHCGPVFSGSSGSTGPLSDSMWLQREILVNPRFSGDITSKDVRISLKGAMKKRKMEPSRSAVVAMDALIASAVVEDVGGPARTAGRWTVKKIRKRPWTQIEGVAVAREFLRSVRVGPDVFQE